MPDTPLIVTSWSVDYAGAAAMALLQHPKAAIETASRRRLPELLEEVAARKAGPRAILILGVGLRHAPERLAAALATLTERCTAITWLSALPFPADLPRSLRALLTGKAGTTGSLTRHVADCLAVPAGADRERVLAVAEAAGRAPAPDLAWVTLILAAASRFRRFRDPGPYLDTIRGLAAGRALGAKDHKMIAEYRENGHRELKGDSALIQELWEQVQLVGRKNCRSVIVTGETGTGKETVARLIHGWSPRADQPFVAVNCAALPENLIESELFGHRRGAFTGAIGDRKGAFEQADNGTLFLDEIGDMPRSTQAKLLRALQENEIRPLGADKPVKVHVGVIAATNMDLVAKVKGGDFREDLYHRLDLITLHIPPLRERREDVAAIANDYQLRQGRPWLTAAQVRQLEGHHWPGNVRELQNILDRADVLSEADFSKLLPAPAERGTATLEGDSLDAAIRRHVRSVYECQNRNKTRSAKALGISVNTLKKYL